MVGTFDVFNTGQSWWGALPNLSTLAQAMAIIGGVFITDRVNKTPLVLAFLGFCYLLFTVAAFSDDTVTVAEVFRTPDVQAALFFAFILLTDPPTAPVKYGDQIICDAKRPGAPPCSSGSAPSTSCSPACWQETCGPGEPPRGARIPKRRRRLLARADHVAREHAANRQRSSADQWAILSAGGRSGVQRTELS